MTYTREELIKACKHVLANKTVDLLLGENVSLPTILQMAVTEAFLSQTPEDRYTALLRQAMRDLHTAGQFKYKDTV